MNEDAPIENVIRPEQSVDESNIRRIIESAFARSAEADLIERLRADNALLLGLVAERPAGVIGYAAFSDLKIDTPKGTVDAVSLGPIAVAPAAQRRGTGSMLIRAGLSMIMREGAKIIFVLGEPAYYRKFGFATAAAAKFNSPYAGPNFMAKRLSDDAPVSGAVRYPRAFAALSD